MTPSSSTARIWLGLVLGFALLMAGLHWALQPSTANGLLLLVIGDLHDDTSNLEQLRLELQRRGVSPDIVLCPGDLTAMPAVIGVRPSYSELARYTDAATLLLHQLRQISSKLYWVPGNHDPDNLFGSGSETETPGTNVHGQVIQLAPGLWLGGWGGAVAATENGEEVWGAYPYSERQLPVLLEPLRVALLGLPPEDALLLLTHAGPASSGTTTVSGTDPNSLLAAGVREHPILSGSAALDDLIKLPKVQQTAILNIHGHTHQGCGVGRIGGVAVVNPGSLRYTKTYALLKLDRADDGRWHRSSLEILELGF